MNIYFQQIEIIESLQKEILSLLENPNNSTDELLKELKDAIESLEVLERCFQNTAIKNLSELVSLILGTNSMTYTPEQIQAAKDRAKVVLDFFMNHQAEMATMKAQLDAALRDDAEAAETKTKLTELQGKFETTQTDLNDFVKSFIDSNSLETPSTSTPTPDPTVPPASSELPTSPLEDPASPVVTDTTSTDVPPAPTVPSNLV